MSDDLQILFPLSQNERFVDWSGAICGLATKLQVNQGVLEMLADLKNAKKSSKKPAGPKNLVIF